VTQRKWGVSCEAAELGAAPDEGEGVGDVITIGSNSKGIPETEWVGYMLCAGSYGKMLETQIVLPLVDGDSATPTFEKDLKHTVKQSDSLASPSETAQCNSV
jgi:hypothetical protein